MPQILAQPVIIHRVLTAAALSRTALECPPALGSVSRGVICFPRTLFRDGCGIFQTSPPAGRPQVILSSISLKKGTTWVSKESPGSPAAPDPQEGISTQKHLATLFTPDTLIQLLCFGRSSYENPAPPGGLRAFPFIPPISCFPGDGGGGQSWLHGCVFVHSQRALAWFNVLLLSP